MKSRVNMNKLFFVFFFNFYAVKYIIVLRCVEVGLFIDWRTLWCTHTSYDNLLMMIIVVKAGVSLNVFITRVADPAADELFTAARFNYRLSIDLWSPY